ncbi:hypothetical protein DL89DRAFT_267973 [Linderina pennispora]|uniref:AB hydrolase-1 domain-containing protein n=1 Tax=Linderina pennispora TaxID=61395 RepID=A0A1Y1W6Z1_9FUNG|nr:uncharacterized protein DL89DRAFT_267973 [Linderina pennispora]ORX68934.1 hypothetical protein DL89DRAFT_267973 [Linderina pennispora]
MLSWTAFHLTAKAFQPEYTGSTARNLKMGKFVLGVHTRVTLWSINQADHQLPVWALFTFFLPVLASAIVLPVVYKEYMAKNSIVEELVDNLVLPREKILDDAPISSYMTLKTGRPAAVIESGSTKFSMYTGESFPLSQQYIRSPLSIAWNSPQTLPSQVSSDEDSPRLLARIGRALLSVIECSILASVLSMTSMVLSILLLTSVSRQHQYSTHTPLIYGKAASELVSMSSYADHSPRIAVFCSGQRQPRTKGGVFAPQHATILIEHPIGYPSLVARSLQLYFVEHGRRVCIYDRPGYMASPLGFAPVAPEAVHKALSQELYAIGESGPFYVIGVDSGSEFAMLFPHDDYVSTIGMALVRPTQLAVAGLLSNGTLAKLMIKHEVLATDRQRSLETLDNLRLLSAIGFLSSGIPAEATIHESDRALAEWAFANPNMAQIQYFEQVKVGMLADTIEEEIQLSSNTKSIPVAVFGLAQDAAKRSLFSKLLSSAFEIELSESNSDKPLTLGTIGEQVSWHIQRIH